MSVNVSVVPSPERLELAIQQSIIKFLKHQEEAPGHTGPCSAKTIPPFILARLMHEELKGHISRGLGDTKPGDTWTIESIEVEEAQ